MSALRDSNAPYILNWSDISKWVSTAALLKFDNLPEGWSLRRIGDFAKQITIRERVNSDQDYELAGVRWYGEGVFHRETVTGRDQSANYLQKLQPGSLIYNRLFAWKASFAVVEPQHLGLFVSNEFPQFEIDLSVALPDYIYLLMLSGKFLKAINAASIGSAAISRNRFKESDFEDFLVPLPCVSDQRSIVELWRKGRKNVEIKQQKSGLIVETLQRNLLEETQDFENIVTSSNFVTLSAHTAQWDIKAGRAAAFIAANPNFARLGDYTKECTETVRPWDSPSTEWPVYGVNNKEGVFLNSLQKGAEFNAPYKRIRKDWFFHNPTRANVGSLGIVPEVPDDAITSPEYQVWRLTGGFLPVFMALLIRTDYFLSLVAFNRVGGVKQRMYYANLAEIRLPMVPMAEQQRVADAYAEVQAGIVSARADLERRKADIEKMILGAMKVEGV